MTNMNVITDGYAGDVTQAYSQALRDAAGSLTDSINWASGVTQPGEQHI